MTTTRDNYRTPCPLILDEQHAWDVDPAASNLRVMRYSCRCGARAWRERTGPKHPRGTMHPIVEYKADSPRSDRARRRKEEAQLLPESSTARPRVAGNNRTGGYLPPGTSGDRR